MSEARDEPSAEDRVLRPDAAEPPTAAEIPPESPARAPSVRRARPGAALWLAGLLALILGAVLLSPFWAPAIAPLLPWARAPAPSDYDALAARIAALEARPVEAPSAPMAGDVDAVKSAAAATARRVAALETTVDVLRRGQGQAADATASVTQLGERIDKIESQATARDATEAAEIQRIQQALAQLGVTESGFGDRLAALEHQVQREGDAGRNGAVLVLALLQMREAAAAGNPFPAEYTTFENLAMRDRELAAAAAPLADIAPRGIASRSTLRQGLADLAAEITAAKVSPVKPKWWAQALDRLSDLVTIRRIEGKPKPGPEAALATAQTALAQGDVAAAVGAIEKLTGADAETARPWLRLAHQRLAAQAALAHLQEMLIARFAPSPAAPATAPAPSSAPPTAKSRS